METGLTNLIEVKTSPTGGVLDFICQENRSNLILTEQILAIPFFY